MHGGPVLFREAAIYPWNYDKEDQILLLNDNKYFLWIKGRWRKSIHKVLDWNLCSSYKKKKNNLHFCNFFFGPLVHESCPVLLLSPSYLPLLSAYEIREEDMQGFCWEESSELKDALCSSS